MQSNTVSSENFRNNSLPPPNMNGFGAPGVGAAGIDSLALYWSDQPPTQQQRIFGGAEEGFGAGSNEFRQRSGSGMFGGVSATPGFGAPSSNLTKQQQWGQIGSVNQTTPWNVDNSGGNI